MKNRFSHISLSFVFAFLFIFAFSSFAFAALSEVAFQGGFKGAIVSLLDNSLIAAALLTLGFAGIMIELFVTGFGVAGFVGVASFALYFFGNIWAGHVSTAVLLLFVLGLLLIIAELFVTPGLGALGILGIAAILFSVFWAAPSAGYAVTAILIALIAAVALIAVTIKFGKTRNVWNRLILKLKQENEQGYVAPNAKLIGLVGTKGYALTVLRPAGTAEIDGRKIDVVTEGEFIEPGTPIEILQVDGMRVVVRKYENAE